MNFADEFKREAKLARGRAVFRNVQGWRFGLSFGQPSDITREEFEHVKRGSASAFAKGAARLLPDTYEEFCEKLAKEVEEAKERGITNKTWTFTASLHPRGRSSTEKDWQYIGKFVAALGAPLGSLMTPPGTTHPNDVHYWMWEDESPNTVRCDKHGVERWNQDIVCSKCDRIWIHEDSKTLGMHNYRLADTDTYLHGKAGDCLCGEQIFGREGTGRPICAECVKERSP